MVPTTTPGIESLLAAKAYGASHERPLEMHAWPHGSECTSSRAVMPRVRSFGSIACRWLSPPVTKPSAEKPYSYADVPPTGGSVIQ